MKFPTPAQPPYLSLIFVLKCPPFSSIYLSIIHIIDVDPWVPIFFPVGYISLPFLIIWHANCSDFANKSPTLAPYEMLTGSDI